MRTAITTINHDILQSVNTLPSSLPVSDALYYYYYYCYCFISCRVNYSRRYISRFIEICAKKKKTSIQPRPRSTSTPEATENDVPENSSGTQNVVAQPKNLMWEKKQKCFGLYTYDVYYFSICEFTIRLVAFRIKSVRVEGDIFRSSQYFS